MADKDKLAKYRTEIQQVCVILFSSSFLFVFVLGLLSFLLLDLAFPISHWSFS